MPLSSRILSILQLTRIALVFTAISNTQAALLLATRGTDPWDVDRLNLPAAGWLLLVSLGLYGFGMSLNDLIDRRRDEAIASDRPLPSGRIGLRTAMSVCLILLLTALLAGAALTHHLPRGGLSFALVAGVAVLICFYDLVGKYVVPLGILTLGMIRFFHAAVPAPLLPVVWHPLLLMAHVTVISLVSYVLEEKRPLLTLRHMLMVFAGLGLFLAVVLSIVSIRFGTHLNAATILSLEPRLLAPLGCAVAFGALSLLIVKTRRDRRAAGRDLMLLGLLWLIVYDAAFVAVYVDWKPALALLALMPVAWSCVLLLRGWGKLASLSRRPDYVRAR